MIVPCIYVGYVCFTLNVLTRRVHGLDAIVLEVCIFHYIKLSVCR
jgi:hypothetical protein